MVFKKIGDLDSARYDLGAGVFSGHLLAIAGYSTTGTTPTALGTMVGTKAGNGGSISLFKSKAPSFTGRGNLKSFLYNNFVFVGAGNSTGASNSITYSSLVATLAYKTQTTFYLPYTSGTGSFTVGQVVTGGSSGAHGVIAAKTGSTATGTLTINTVTGTFTAAETITDPITGSATNTGAQIRATFTAGATVTGGTSAATAHIVSDANSGATGTLTVNATTGTFLANETLTDSVTGIAVVNTPVQGIFTTTKTITGGTSAATATIVTDTDHGNATGTLTLTSIVGTFQSGETITDSGGVSGSATTTSAVTVGGQVPQMLSGQLNGTASVSQWNLVASPAELINYQVFGFENFLYVAGGTTAALANSTNIYKSEINGNGTLGAWSTVGTLPGACTKNTNVTSVLGNVINMVVDGNVWTAKLSAGNGQVSTWTVTPMITSLNAPAVLRVGNTLLAIGGKNGSGTTLMNTYAVRLNAAGVPQSDWIQGSNLVTARSAHAVAVDGASLWVLGGLDSSGAALSSVEFCIIPGNQIL